MKPLLLFAFGVAVLIGFAPARAAGADSRIFPFPYTVDDLDNGLRLVTVPLPYPDLVVFYAVVRAGSRDEVEPGKSGFAHFFEHMMFRGTEKYPAEKYNEILKGIGASTNAYTTDDYTAYHMVFGKQDLPTVMEIEADRFRNLRFTQEDFRTEAKAVLGEYNKNSANPFTKLYEVLREASFEKHTYRHTTMGFLRDIEAMPDQYEYGLTFFDRFYRPENTVLVVAGDVRREEVLALTKKHWGEWKRGTFRQRIPDEPEPAGPYRVHLDWETPTLPWVVVAYRGPAFSDTSPEMAALDLAGEIAFSESSPLYRELVIEDQVVDSFFTFFGNRRDPGLLLIAARVKDVKDAARVRNRILETVETLKAQPVPRERLEAVKANLKYAFALSMDNTESVAASLAQFVQLAPTPETINNLYALYDALTPEQVRDHARRYFHDRRLTLATLTGPGDAIVEAPPSRREAPAAAADASDPGGTVRTVLRPAEAPLVSFRIAFGVGAAHDPEGKEGVAALTAAMLSRGGSASMAYDAIVQAMYPMAAGVSAQVDKEMTVFSGTTHRDNLDRYYDILSSMLLDPGWRAEDFERVRDDAVNYLKVTLRGNNDEELGKEALYEFIYGADHPYAHETTGTLAALERMTLDDVKAFHAAHYTRANLTVGLAGGYDAAFADRMRRDFGKLAEGTPSRRAIPAAPAIRGRQVRILRKDTRATAISMGSPIEVTRAHPDWPALWLVRSWLGEHRSQNAHLFQRIREERGLNYGDYAYIEHFPRGMFQFRPDPNLVRQRQIFQIWIRPVEPANAHFAIRIALYELGRLVERGLDAAAFEATRDYLMKNAALLARTQSEQLGWAIDMNAYGLPEFVPWIRERLGELTLDQVNAVIRKHLQADRIKILVVAKDAEALRRAIVSEAPSPITYNAPKPAEILAEDRIIEALKLGIGEDAVAVVDIEKVFAE